MKVEIRTQKQSFFETGRSRSTKARRLYLLLVYMCTTLLSVVETALLFLCICSLQWYLVFPCFHCSLLEFVGYLVVGYYLQNVTNRVSKSISISHVYRISLLYIQKNDLVHTNHDMLSTFTVPATIENSLESRTTVHHTCARGDIA